MTVSLKDVVERMSNESNNSTLGWDVVVNYSDTELNALLKSSYHNDPKSHITALPLTVTGYDEEDNPYMIQYHFELGPPLLTFVGSGVRPSCTLTIPVNGGYSRMEKGGQQPVPAESYDIALLNLEMATMCGSTGSLTPSEKPYVFPSEGSKPAAVTIDFRTSSQLVAKLNLRAGAPESKRVKAHRGELENQIFTFFTNPDTATSIRYQIATVESTPEPSGSLVLHPTSFRFAVYHSEQYPRTILSVFIQTAEGLNGGTQVDLQQKWQSKWIGEDAYQVPPIPDTHTASIIINNAVMTQRVIIPALKKAGFDIGDPTWTKGEGHCYKVKTHKKVHLDAWTNTIPTVSIEARTAIDANLDDENKRLNLVLGQNGNTNQPARGALNWSFSYDFEYSRSWFVGTPQWKTTVGKASITHTLSKSTSNILTDTTLALSLDIQKSDWQKTVSKNEPGLWERFWGGATIPDWIADLSPEMPSLSVKVGDLYFFLTTNLLLPGEKVIAIDASSGAGLRIPRDFYIVGSIVSK